MSESHDSPKPEPPKLLELYSVYRGYVEHENELINIRSTLSLTFQGLMFAGYGVTFQLANGTLSPGKPVAPVVEQLLKFFPYCGALVGLLALLGVIAAELALCQLNRKWEELKKAYEQETAYFPGLLGGGSKPAKRLGTASQVLIPAVVVIAWAYLLLYKP